MNTDTTNPKDLVGAKKPQLHLVPPALIIHTSKAMENGAKKFGAYNWREKKIKMTVYIAAAMRHLNSLLDGEDLAVDSDVHHAAHTAACMGIILDALECDCLIDDRPPKGCAAALIARMTEQKAPATPEPEEAQITCPECKITSVGGRSHYVSCSMNSAFFNGRQDVPEPVVQPQSALVRGYCHCGALLRDDGTCSAS